MRHLTVAIAGLGGNIGTTLAAGLAYIQQGGHPLGLLTEASWPVGSHDGPSLTNRLSLPPLSTINVIGWDHATRPLHELAFEKCIVPPHVLARTAPWLQTAVAQPAPKEEWAVWLNKANLQLSGERSLGRDIVLLDLLPARPSPPECSIHRDLAEFENALFDNSNVITPSMMYAWLALSNGIPYVNFTSNVSAEIPALQELARRTHTPTCGKDGKTGQTLFKTALAPALALRSVRVDGWISANYLGNADGLNLDDRDRAAEKIRHKRDVLTRILGYDVPDHIVDIRYYRPRGDFKEAWDSIDFRGFCEVPMQLKLDLLGADSVLAAPVALDAARLLHKASSSGAHGAQEQFSLFFKYPILDGSVEHDLFRQRDMLERWVEISERQESSS